MVDEDYSIILRERISQHDLDGVFNVLCMLNGWVSDDLLTKCEDDFGLNHCISRLKKYYKNKVDFFLARYQKDYQRREELTKYVNSEFSDTEKDFVWDLVFPHEKTYKDLIEDIVSLDFTPIIGITDDCRADIISYLLIEIPFIGFNRGFYCSLLKDCSADRLAFALSVYDFEVRSFTRLTNKANLLLKWAKQLTDYYEDIPEFKDLSNTCYNSPQINSDLKSKLLSYGISERVLLLKDFYKDERLFSNRKTKEMGIDEKLAKQKFVSDGILIPDINDGTSQLIINPIFLTDMQQLVYYQENISLLIKALCLI